MVGIDTTNTGLAETGLLVMLAAFVVFGRILFFQNNTSNERKFEEKMRSTHNSRLILDPTERQKQPQPATASQGSINSTAKAHTVVTPTK